MDDDRTEPPSPRRLAEARKKGQVVKSIDLSSAIVLLAGFWILGSSGPTAITAMRTLVERSLKLLPTAEANLTVTTMRSAALEIGQLVIEAIAPLTLATIVIALVVNLAQTRGLVSLHTIQPDASKVNPVNGFKRLFSAHGLVQLVKSLLKLAVIGWVVYGVLRDNYPVILATGRMTLLAGLGQVASVALQAGQRAAMVLLVIGLLDYFYQRRQFMKSMRMTKQEVKEEAKLQENPEIRGRIRQRMREAAIRRMMAAVPKADVVITNPTHLAVVLRYEKGRMQAPQVVAKGQRLIAERIKEVAREHGVPVVENKPLAQALFKSVEIGQEIPVSLYQAVAEVLAFVYRLKSGHRAAAAPVASTPGPAVSLQLSQG